MSDEDIKPSASLQYNIPECSDIIRLICVFLKNSEEDKKDRLPLVCKLMQCIFCLSNECKSYLGRTFGYATPHKMMNEIGKHLEGFAAEDEVLCPHPQCKAVGLVLPTVMGFKNHTATVHKIILRA